MNFVKRTDEHLEINIVGLVLFILKKLPLFILSGVLVGGAAFLAADQLLTPQYEASINMYVNNVYVNNLGFLDSTGGLFEKLSISQSDLNASAQLAQMYAIVAVSDTVLDQVIETGGFSEILSSNELMQKVTCESVKSTGLIKITVKDNNPQMAADLANLMADIVPETISEIVEGSSAKIVDRAKVPKNPASPNRIKYAILGFLGGAAICFMVLMLRAIFDVRIKQEEDLGQWEYPVLGTVPDFKVYKSKTRTPAN